MERYNIYYQRYNILARDYIPYVRVVDTKDVYHEIGKMICTTLEEMKNIRYTKPKATYEECVELWEEKGYKKISDDTWRLDDPKFKDVVFEEPTEPIPIEPKKLAEMLCLAVRQMTDDEGPAIGGCRVCWIYRTRITSISIIIFHKRKKNKKKGY